jgi:hypothetical protein
MGYTASRFGVAEAMVHGGVVCTGIGVAAFLWLRRTRAAAAIAARAGRAAMATGGQAARARPR